MSKKVRVRKSVFVAAKTLQEDAPSHDRKAHQLAQDRLDECDAAGDVTGKQFWRDVWIHLMLIEYERGEIEVIND